MAGVSRIITVHNTKGETEVIIFLTARIVK